MYRENETPCTIPTQTVLPHSLIIALVNVKNYPCLPFSLQFLEQVSAYPKKIVKAASTKNKAGVYIFVQVQI